jgi:hypothetical protein
LSPLSVIAIPLVLILIGIIWNSFYIVHDQPEFSLEEDPVNKLAAERRATYQVLQLQRARILKRQKRIGRYGWLVLGAFIASSWFLYSATVTATTVSKQVIAIETLEIADSKEMVLSLTLSDGSEVKYLLKTPEKRPVPIAQTVARSKDHVQNWQLTSLGTAVIDGAAAVPLRITLRIANSIANPVSIAQGATNEKQHFLQKLSDSR